MTIDKNTALILEGGGMRGVFTCGVLKAVQRVFWEYPAQILSDPAAWFAEILKFF